MPKMVKVHVTYNETKRIISHEKGGEVKELRHRFLQVFSDVLLNQVAPANVKLQRYDDRFADYVELSCDEKLEDDVKIRAVVSKQEKQTTNPSSPESEKNSNHVHCWPHWAIPWYLIHATGGAHKWVPTFDTVPIFVRPHPVKQHTCYRLWNPVSRQNDSLIQRDPSSNIVSCDGSFSSKGDVVIETSTISQNFVSLLFKDNAAKKTYVVTAENGQNDKINIIALEVQPGGTYADVSTFEPVYYYSYTMFRNKWYSQGYLGCDNTGKTTLVTNSSLDYPNPQTLFILNDVILKDDVAE